MDVDLWVDPTVANSKRVIAALKAWGAPLRTHGVVAEDFAKEGTVYQIGAPPRRIDILTSIDGVSFEEGRVGHLYVSVGGLEIPLIGREALVKNKRASGRPKDLADLLGLGET